MTGAHLWGWVVVLPHPEERVTLESVPWEWVSWEWVPCRWYALGVDSIRRSELGCMEYMLGDNWRCEYIMGRIQP